MLSLIWCSQTLHHHHPPPWKIQLQSALIHSSSKRLNYLLFMHLTSNRSGEKAHKTAIASTLYINQISPQQQHKQILAHHGTSCTDLIAWFFFFLTRSHSSNDILAIRCPFAWRVPHHHAFFPGAVDGEGGRHTSLAAEPRRSSRWPPPIAGCLDLPPVEDIASVEGTEKWSQ